MHDIQKSDHWTQHWSHQARSLIEVLLTATSNQLLSSGGATGAYQCGMLMVDAG